MGSTNAAEDAVRRARTEFPIAEPLRDRWSSRAVRPDKLPDAVIGSLFEAARWSPSAGNGQPWSFIVADQARDPEGFAAALQLLNESNQTWAKQAALLVFPVTRCIRENGKEHFHAQYDLGLGVMGLVVQAETMGLNVRQMAGFDRDATRQRYGIPKEYEPVSAMAIGYPGEIDDLPEEMQAQFRAPRERKPLESFVFTGQFGQTYPVINGQGNN